VTASDPYSTSNQRQNCNKKH